MKNIMIGCLAICLALLCLGMGGIGGYPEGTVPETEIDIQAVVTDRAGVTTNITQFSMDGKIILKASHGRGVLTVPFQNVATIKFGETLNNEINASVELKSGEWMDMKVSGRARFYGATDFGAYQVRASDVAEIRIL
ncbi:MAG: hypothetical protein JRF07_05105 [Deltaproteobacteria bacterium]|jgi:hypothetical protein|nr:hypothetical protein [Deltaproteobacteria bacterium]MBW2518770.1 hypothetical protein [Deltaproteobacteria bacterium]